MSLYVNIEKRLGSFQLKLELETDDAVSALLGASGCGKSMLLKCIAGIERPDKGRIVLDGVTLFDSNKRIKLAPQRRRVGYLFQQYALFPNMSALENIEAGVRDRRRAKGVAQEMIRAMRLDEVASLRPHQLSGGQQQRVALARILVNEPNALLLDEPFSALDSHLRHDLECEVRSIVRSFGKTVLLVSHDKEEVYFFCDHVAIMKGGRIEAFGARDEIFHNPSSRNAAQLLGYRNISRITRLGGRRIYADDWGVELLAGREVMEDEHYIAIRIDALEMGQGENEASWTLKDVMENPFSYTIMLKASGRKECCPLGWEIDKETWRRVGAREMTLRLPQEAIMLLKE